MENRNQRLAEVTLLRRNYTNIQFQERNKYKKDYSRKYPPDEIISNMGTTGISFTKEKKKEKPFYSDVNLMRCLLKLIHSNIVP
jgi:hypothetical protein